MQRRVKPYRKTGSLFDNHSDDDSSLEEDKKGLKDTFDISDLYKHIGAPVRLKDRTPGVMEVKTALKPRFSKLPMAMHDFKYSGLNTDPSKSTDLERLRIEYEKQEAQKALTAKLTGAMTSFRETLFTLYPDADARLVYKKYLNHGDLELEQQGFANYLVDVSKIVKTEQPHKGMKGGKTLILATNERSDQTLRFDSTFESGNLYSAYKLSDTEYDLVLQNDINTRGHTQWFFFSVENTKKDNTIKFNIINLLKPDSLFSTGMQPVVYSTSGFHLEDKGWHRDGFNISYTKNSISKEENQSGRSYYTLSFTYTFKYSQDHVFFAHSFPYTHTRLTTFLDALCQDPDRKKYVKRKTLCQTLSQSDCEYLTITSPKYLTKEEKDDRPAVILTARQHPGESLGSHMMQGIIEFLTSEEPEAKILRKYWLFKIVPMMNPDGVTYGNYRASLCGMDLNRTWKTPDRLFQPTVYHTKELILELNKTHNVQFVCDFHGHSRRKNAFLYGNAVEGNPLSARIFPLLLSRMSKYVSFEDCRFKVEKAKEETARVALWKELKIPTVYTLEASFYGYDIDGKTEHFTEEDYMNIGKDFCKSLCVYLSDTAISKGISTKKDGKHADQAQNESEGPVFRVSDLMDELNKNKRLIEIGNQSEGDGSDSDLSEDDLSANELRKILPKKPKGLKKSKTKFRSRKQKGVIDKKKELDKPDLDVKELDGFGPWNPVSEEKMRPNSAKNATFLIKSLTLNLKQTTSNTSTNNNSFKEKEKDKEKDREKEKEKEKERDQEKDKDKEKEKEKDASTRAMEPIEEVEMIDQETQTDVRRETLATEEPEPLQPKIRPGTQAKRKSPSKSMSKGVGTSSRGMDSPGRHASYLTVFNPKCFSLKAAAFKNVINNLANFGSKVDSDEEPTAKKKILRHQVTQGISTEDDMKSSIFTESRISSQIWKMSSSVLQNEEIKKVLSQRQNQLLFDEKEVSVQSVTQEDEEDPSMQQLYPKDYNPSPNLGPIPTPKPKTSPKINPMSPGIHTIDMRASLPLPNSPISSKFRPHLRKFVTSPKLPPKLFETNNSTIIKNISTTLKPGSFLLDRGDSPSEKKATASSPLARLIKDSQPKSPEDKFLQNYSAISMLPSYKVNGDLINSNDLKPQKTISGPSTQALQNYGLFDTTKTHKPVTNPPHVPEIKPNPRPGTALYDQALIKTAAKIAKQMKDRFRKKERMDTRTDASASRMMPLKTNSDSPLPRTVSPNQTMPNGFMKKV